MTVLAGYKYEFDKFGAFNQIDPEPFAYDDDYVALYDQPAYESNETVLMSLRIGFVAGALGRMPQSLFDYGYGNGAFMRHASRAIPKVLGLDPAARSVEGCETVENVVPTDVLTMWDVIEHLPSLDFIGDLAQEMLVVSTPYCHVRSHGVKWFESEYPHRKPNEHIRHFDRQSLAATLESYGWSEEATSTHEDVVRRSKHESQNILVAAFKRR